MADPIKVTCQRDECASFKKIEGDKYFCLCSHEKKAYHLHDDPCPLFRPDWTKVSSQKQDDLMKRFGIGAKPK